MFRGRFLAHLVDEVVQAVDLPFRAMDAFEDLPAAARKQQELLLPRARLFQRQKALHRPRAAARVAQVGAQRPVRVFFPHDVSPSLLFFGGAGCGSSPAASPRGGVFSDGRAVPAVSEEQYKAAF